MFGGAVEPSGFPQARLCRYYFFVIPGKQSATRNPVFAKLLVFGLRRADVRIQAFAGMTKRIAIKQMCKLVSDRY